VGEMAITNTHADVFAPEKTEEGRKKCGKIFLTIFLVQNIIVFEKNMKSFIL